MATDRPDLQSISEKDVAHIGPNDLKHVLNRKDHGKIDSIMSDLKSLSSKDNELCVILINGLKEHAGEIDIQNLDKVLAKMSEWSPQCHPSSFYGLIEKNIIDYLNCPENMSY